VAGPDPKDNGECGHFTRDDVTVAQAPKAEREGYDHLIGRPVEGEYVFEVPVQTSPVPESAIKSLDELDIVLRDVNGKVYN
jgi:hypothetical protein